MTQRALHDRKVADLREAVAALVSMHERQCRLAVQAPDLYDSAVHHAALAQALQSAYTRLESLLKGLLAVGGGLPLEDTPAWHRDLLLRCTLPVGPDIPPLLTEESRRALLGLLAFRHAVRNAYVHELRIEDVARQAEDAGRILPPVLDRLSAWIDRCFGPLP